MHHRFEVVTFDAGRCELQFRASGGELLLASSRLRLQDDAIATLEWLRSALQKDWLYRIGRKTRHHGPLFVLNAPGGITCTGGPFSSSDHMERAIQMLRTAAPEAPVVLQPGLREHPTRYGLRTTTPRTANEMAEPYDAYERV